MLRGILHIDISELMFAREFRNYFQR